MVSACSSTDKLQVTAAGCAEVWDACCLGPCACVLQYKHEVGSLQQKLSGLTREELQRALGVKPMDKSSRSGGSSARQISTACAQCSPDGLSGLGRFQEMLCRGFRRHTLPANMSGAYLGWKFRLQCEQRL